MSDEQASRAERRFPWRRTIALLVVALIAVGGSFLLIETGPATSRRPPAPMQANVEAIKLARTDARVVVEGMGAVIPQKSVEIRAQVGGEVVEMGEHFSEGRMLEKGELLLRLDDRDYQIALQQAEANLLQAQSSLAIEDGSQTIARREWELIKEAAEVSGANSSLALREPQLQSAKATVATAQANLDDAKLDLERTRIVAPFNAIVLEKNADMGSYIPQQSTVATLAGLDTYWVQVAVPESQLGWLTIPAPGETSGSRARVYPNSTTSRYREAYVVALLGDLDPAGRMARLLVAVEDPLAIKPENRGQPALLLGDYVRVEIDGTELKDIFQLPRESFHEGSRVWIVGDNDQLEIRPLSPVWMGDESVIVADGLEVGERLVLSNLSMPAPGLKLLVAEVENPLSTNGEAAP
ncbi:efflux RND transporter periplasmic adaptor subunit [Ruficoccus amylovorans]|uniref:Efflux RND transporter periplasmic adaptor subunit n=1 Tax=Ruficoccus amylovorans TaxID=1804625 RepID=A0A842HES2_9BACT|nr:efflux RND transporter periplasmic adaptor subunit [Ruficoccus amylovorans]MBC2595095.1 efflux RND transporter periplasmic adaptor subunit [Ruficoccus amylovorans]